MDLQYKGVSKRGRVVWVDKDYHEEKLPGRFEFEDWQVPRYRDLVESAESSIGRKLTKKEARIMEWLSGGERDTCNVISRLVKEAFENGKNTAPA